MVDPAKIEIVSDWDRPTSPTEGFTMYCYASGAVLGCILMQQYRVIINGSWQLKLGRVLACVEARSFLMEQIQAQFEDPHLRVIRDKEHVISKEGIMVDLAKLKAIRSWARPISTMQIRIFIRLTGYYRLFIEGFSTIVASFTHLNHQDVPFVWSKELLTTTLVLTLLVKGESFSV
ncbi:uncharacterized mitochondrial protein AtMg00860-like [Solanum dulcamara]|uniref:uncharacterized mitochondrial protein AtMg00860-like n=1 Tax=Solanum dulcamara TaxID=45834 RepID=UPI0024864B60|nr:uncharacterized mitochondrial protein AtMg00860-like [Solanum dulcamara]